MKDGDGFGIRKVYNSKSLTRDDVKEIIRNIGADFGHSETRVLRYLQDLGIGQRLLSGIDIAAELKMAVGSNTLVGVRNGRARDQGRNNGSSTESRGNTRVLSEKDGRNEERDGIQELRTPDGELYGFAYRGEIWLDETKMSPNALLHEYTHLWDNVLMKADSNSDLGRLWSRGKELMQQLALWNKIAMDENYGKKWQAQGKSKEEIFGKLLHMSFSIRM